MLFGVTLSIKTSVDKEVRESRMQNEINLFEEEEDEDDTLNSEVFSGLNANEPLTVNKLRVKKTSKRHESNKKSSIMNVESDSRSRGSNISK